MNDLTRQILTEILKTNSAWDPKTRELRYKQVMESYCEYREVLFTDQVFFPRLLRAYRLMRAWGIFPEEAFEWTELEGLEGWWLTDNEAISLVEERFNHPYYGYFPYVWESPEWACEEPSQEEILALGVRPTQVPSKVYKEGGIQPALF